MTRSFRTLAVTTSALCIALSASWLLGPNIWLELWGVSGYTGAAGLVARRAAALFLGFAVLLFEARELPPSAGRRAIALGFATACGALALLGTAELVVGHAQSGIMLPILTEFTLAVLFGRTLVHHPDRAHPPAS
jgi:hypothetical protein